jgi:hypothetical protein
MDLTNIKCQNGPVLTPAQDFYFNGQPLNDLSLSLGLYPAVDVSDDDIHLHINHSDTPPRRPRFTKMT